MCAFSFLVKVLSCYYLPLSLSDPFELSRVGLVYIISLAEETLRASGRGGHPRRDGLCPRLQGPDRQTGLYQILLQVNKAFIPVGLSLLLWP